MILSAIEHNATGADCFALSRGKFQIRLRSARDDLQAVILHFQDKYIPVDFYDTRDCVEMKLLTHDKTTDYWTADLQFDVVCLRYWFELRDQAGNVRYYSNYSFSSQPVTDTDDMFDCPQNLREEERFETPSWAENQVIYQIFPTRFASSRPVEEHLWYKAPISHLDDLHGDLRGIINHLDHLKTLGVDVIYMTPIFKSRSCHKYDTIDYYCVDPSLGTAEDLKELVQKAHALGLRVILDGVFNHTSPEFFAFADIRRNGAQSRYLDWYFIQGFPLRAPRGEKPNFKTFSYYGGMPKLNVKNPEVARYILDVALYWLRECGIDGWRLDVGDEVGHSFWKQFRAEVKKEFPEALIIGEVWHYAPDFLQGDEWDTVMNYPFYQNVRDLLTGKISAAEFSENLGFLQGRYHPKVYPLLWNLIDSHDTPRMLHTCGSVEKLRLAAALQLLLPGMPMIYYGDEVGLDGAKDPDCRRGMLWDRQNSELLEWYRRLIEIRKTFPVLQRAEQTVEGNLLIRSTPELRLIFNCGAQAVSGYSGMDLLQGMHIDQIPGYGTVLL